jgi:hypothetical protein
MAVGNITADPPPTIEVQDVYMVECVFLHFDPDITQTEKDAAIRRATTIGGLTRDAIFNKIEELRQEIAANPNPPPFIPDNNGPETLSINLDIFKEQIKQGLLMIRKKPLNAANNETVTFPCLRQIVRNFNEAFDIAFRDLITDSPYPPWMMFATVWVEERPAKDVLRLRALLHNFNANYVMLDSNSNITTSTVPTAAPMVPIVQATGNLTAEHNYMEWHNQINQRAGDIALLNSVGNMNEPPPEHLRNLRVYETAQGNMEPQPEHADFIQRIGQGRFDLLVYICTHNYGWSTPNTLQYFDNLKKVFCLIPALHQRESSFTFQPHNFDKMWQHLLGRGPNHFIVIRLMFFVFTAFALFARSVELLIAAGDICAAIRQGMYLLSDLMY